MRDGSTKTALVVTDGLALWNPPFFDCARQSDEDASTVWAAVTTQNDGHVPIDVDFDAQFYVRGRNERGTKAEGSRRRTLAQYSWRMSWVVKDDAGIHKSWEAS